MSKAVHWVAPMAVLMVALMAVDWAPSTGTMVAMTAEPMVVY